MKKFITERFALNGLIAILSLFIMFHLLVIINVIPFGVVWGGAMKDRSQMLTFETVSIAINIFMLAVSITKAGYLKAGVNQLFIRVILWIMLAFFVFNALGNLLSDSKFEKLVFTPITLILSIFSLRLALIKDKRN